MPLGIWLERNKKKIKEVERLWEKVTKVARFNASLRESATQHFYNYELGLIHLDWSHFL